jgi:hypothetical protein
MNTIDLDIGKNIAATAKESGAYRYRVESHWGLQFYEIVDMPPNLAVRFSRRGQEITVTPLFSLLMSADSENHNNMAVESIELQFSRHAAKTHEEARVIINDIVAQFQKGNWKRYISDSSPAVTGRSAYLDQDGAIGTLPFLDPAYSPSMDDWLELMKTGSFFQWSGDGILAELYVKYDIDSRGLTYNIELNFKDLAINNRRIAALQQEDLKEGDKKGWKSTERHKKDMEEMIQKIRILEKNAVNRGDLLVPRN